MSTALGLVAFAGFILAVIGVAAGATWIVVKLVPPKTPGAPPKA